MSEIQAIFEDVKSGAFEKEEYLGFILYMIRKILFPILGVLAFVAAVWIVLS